MANETGIVIVETFIIITDENLPTPNVKGYGKIQAGQTLGTLNLIETFTTEATMVGRLTALGVTFNQDDAFGYN